MELFIVYLMEHNTRQTLSLLLSKLKKKNQNQFVDDPFDKNLAKH